MNSAELATEIGREISTQLEESMVKVRHIVKQLSEAQIWQRPAGSNNSVGNLLLHMAGNLNQWGIIPLTGEADERDRDWEFSCDSPFDAAELLQRIEATVNKAKLNWDKMSETTLLTPKKIQGFDVSVLCAVLHTTSHFVGHTHQIILLARQYLGEKYEFQWTPEADRGDVPI